VDSTYEFAEYLWSNGTTVAENQITEPGDVYLTVTDDHGCQGNSDTITIENMTPRLTLVIKSDTIFCEGESVELVAQIDNYNPETEYTYTWSDASQDSAIIVTTSGDYHFNVFNEVAGCENESDTTEVIVRYPYDNLDICIVSVDTATGKNAVIWERPENEAITDFKIYREAPLGGYDLLATLPFDDFSYWLDNTSEPDVKSHKYKISVIDSCDNESALSNYHKTMLLTTSLGPDRINLDWTEYVVENTGFAFIGYIIYRGTGSDDLEPIDTIPSDNTVYPDINPPDGDNSYRVAGVRENPCNPSGIQKAGAGPYYHSLSNLDKNRLNDPPPTNETPTDIDIDVDTILEDSNTGTLVGRFTTTDPDTVDTHTYTLVSGDGDTDNASFTIIGDSLVTASVFDFETKVNYSVRIRTTDSGTDNLYFEKQFAIEVINVIENQAPTDISMGSSSVDENEATGTLVGRFSTTDADGGDTHAYMLVSGTGDDDNASFSITGDSLLTAEVFDFETKASYSIRVKSTDSGEENLEYEEQMSVTIVNVVENQAPSDISLGNITILENEAIGSLVGRFSTSDADAGDIHTYSLVSGSGDTDNSSFSISGDSLITAVMLDFEIQSSMSIRTRSTDDGEGNLNFEKSFTVIVQDKDETGLENSNSPGLKIYPNPASQSLTIEFPNPGRTEYILILTDLTGKRHRIIENITEPEITLIRGDLDDGYYMIEIRGEKTYWGQIILE